MTESGQQIDKVIAALPPGGVRILHRGSREMWRLWLLRNRAGEQ